MIDIRSILSIVASILLVFRYASGEKFDSRFIGTGSTTFACPAGAYNVAGSPSTCQWCPSGEGWCISFLKPIDPAYTKRYSWQILSTLLLWLTTFGRQRFDRDLSGSFSSDQGASACENCPAGTYSDSGILVVIAWLVPIGNISNFQFTMCCCRSYRL